MNSSIGHYGKINNTNVIRVGAPSSHTSAYGNDQTVFRAEEAWNIDKKIDDGSADSGILVSTCGTGLNTGTVCKTCTDNHWSA